MSRRSAHAVLDGAVAVVAEVDGVDPDPAGALALLLLADAGRLVGGHRVDARLAAGEQEVRDGRALAHPAVDGGGGAVLDVVGVRDDAEHGGEGVVEGLELGGWSGLGHGPRVCRADLRGDTRSGHGWRRRRRPAAAAGRPGAAPPRAPAWRTSSWAAAHGVHLGEQLAAALGVLVLAEDLVLRGDDLAHRREVALAAGEPVADSAQMRPKTAPNATVATTPTN